MAGSQSDPLNEFSNVKTRFLSLIGLALCGGLWGGCVGPHGEVRGVAVTGLQIIDIHMCDVRHGWAEANGSVGYRVLRTMDGGEDWKDVTPGWEVAPPDPISCQFANVQTAWVTFRQQGAYSLLLTTNGGDSWIAATTPFGFYTESSNVRFYGGHSGMADIEDGGLGSSYHSFYDTQDGGRTWQPADLIPPGPVRDGDSKMVRLSNIFGDRMGYYPPDRFLIAYGDSGDEKPKGYVALRISADGGRSWRELRLPLPAEWREECVAPDKPSFFGQRVEILPVELFRDGDISRTNDGLLFYVTRDGGESWMVRPAVPGSQYGWGYGDLAVISARDMIVRRGGNFSVTHDGARTWETIQPNVDLGEENAKRDLERMDFVDAKHGWMIISDNSKDSWRGNFLCYRTVDGGKTWEEEDLRIEP